MSVACSCSIGWMVVTSTSSSAIQRCVAGRACNSLAYLWYRSSFSASIRSTSVNAAKRRFRLRISAGLALPEDNETGIAGLAAAKEGSGDKGGACLTSDSLEPLGMMSLGRGLCAWVSVSVWAVAHLGCCGPCAQQLSLPLVSLFSLGLDPLDFS